MVLLDRVCVLMLFLCAASMLRILSTSFQLGYISIHFCCLITTYKCYIKTFCIFIQLLFKPLVYAFLYFNTICSNHTLLPLSIDIDHLKMQALLVSNYNSLNTFNKELKKHQ